MTALDDRLEVAPSRRPQLIRDIAKIVLVALLFVALGWLFNSDLVSQYFDIRAWREILQEAEFLGGPLFGGLAFVAAGGAVIALGVPRIWIAAVGGAVYGAVVGSILAIGAALIGATVLYYVGRRFLRDVVRRRVGGRLEVWRARFRANGFWWVLYGRLFPLSNSTAVSVLCGSCEVPYAKYAVASFIGFIPFTLIFAIFGSGGAKANSWQIVLGLGLMLLAFFSRNLLRAAFPVRRDGQGGTA